VLAVRRAPRWEQTPQIAADLRPQQIVGEIFRLEALQKADQLIGGGGRMMTGVVGRARCNPPPLPTFTAQSGLREDSGDVGWSGRTGCDPRRSTLRPLEELMETTNRNRCSAREKSKDRG
jgi:hypothetical protein